MAAATDVSRAPCRSLIGHTVRFSDKSALKFSRYIQKDASSLVLDGTLTEGNKVTRIAAKCIEGLSRKEEYLREKEVLEELKGKVHQAQILNSFELPCFDAKTSEITDSFFLVFPLYKILEPAFDSKLDSVRHQTFEMCKGLIELNEKGYVHSKIIPQNTMVDSTKTLRFINYGHVRKFGSTALGGFTFNSPPEHLADPAFPLSSQYDLWNWGIMLYRWTTGKPFYQLDDEWYCAIKTSSPRLTGRLLQTILKRVGSPSPAAVSKLTETAKALFNADGTPTFSIDSTFDSVPKLAEEPFPSPSAQLLRSLILTLVSWDRPATPQEVLATHPLFQVPCTIDIKMSTFPQEDQDNLKICVFTASSEGIRLVALYPLNSTTTTFTETWGYSPEYRLLLETKTEEPRKEWSIKPPLDPLHLSLQYEAGAYSLTNIAAAEESL